MGSKKSNQTNKDHNILNKKKKVYTWCSSAYVLNTNKSLSCIVLLESLVILLYNGDSSLNFYAYSVVKDALNPRGFVFKITDRRLKFNAFHSMKVKPKVDWITKKL